MHRDLVADLAFFQFRIEYEDVFVRRAETRSTWRGTERAIALMLAELETRPYVPAARPAYPDRKGMGLPDADR
jgi:hypothetical protein